MVQEFEHSDTGARGHWQRWMLPAGILTCSMGHLCMVRRIRERLPSTSATLKQPMATFPTHSQKQSAVAPLDDCCCYREANQDASCKSPNPHACEYMLEQGHSAIQTRSVREMHELTCLVELQSQCMPQHMPQLLCTLHDAVAHSCKLAAHNRGLAE